MKIKVTRTAKTDEYRRESRPAVLLYSTTDDGYSLHGAVCVHGGWQKPRADKPLC